MKTVLAGASGATGKELLQLLLADPAITRVIALVRRPLAIQHEKLSEEVVCFGAPDTWEPLVTGDVAFSCLGTTLKAAGSRAAQHKVDYGYQLAFAKAARKNNIPCFIFQSLRTIEKTGATPCKKVGLFDVALCQTKSIG